MVGLKLKIEFCLTDYTTDRFNPQRSPETDFATKSTNIVVPFITLLLTPLQ